MSAADLNVDILRRKAGLGLGQYVSVRDNKHVPGSIVVEYFEGSGDRSKSKQQGFDTEQPEYVTAIINWLREAGADGD